MRFQTMPLRFRVWDKALKCFIRYEDIYDSSYDQSKIELEIIDLAHYLYNVDEKPENVVISQDTGLKDKNGKSIYTGDILEWGKEIGYVEIYKGQVVLNIITSPSHIHLLYDNQEDTKVSGHIWQNPELLEAEK